MLGVNGRGKTHIAAFQKLKNVQVALLCDPDSKVLADRAESQADAAAERDEAERRRLEARERRDRED